MKKRRIEEYQLPHGFLLQFLSKSKWNHPLPPSHKELRSKAKRETQPFLLDDELKLWWWVTWTKLTLELPHLTLNFPFCPSHLMLHAWPTTDYKIIKYWAPECGPWVDPITRAGGFQPCQIWVCFQNLYQSFGFALGLSPKPMWNSLAHFQNPTTCLDPTGWGGGGGWFNPTRRGSRVRWGALVMLLL